MLDLRVASEHLATLPLSKHSSEGAVLPQLASARRPRGERFEYPFDRPVEQVLPLTQPDLRRPSRRRREHPVEVATRTLQCPHRVADKMGGYGLRQPQASQLVATKPPRPRAHRFDVMAGDTTVTTNSGEWQLAAVAQVDHVLARSAEQHGCFTGRQQVISFGVGELLSEGFAHKPRLKDKPKKRNRHASLLR